MSTDTITQEEREHWRQQRIAAIEYEGRVRGIPCERCGAKVGEPCYSPEYYTGSYHKVRRVAAGVR